MAEYAKLKLVELRALLKSKGLPVTGTKSELVARLTEADAAAPAEEAAVEAQDETDAKAEDKPEEKAPEPAAEPAPATEPAAAPVEAATETAPAAGETPAEAVATETKSQEENNPPPAEELSTEAKTALVVAELKKRIERSERFGGTGDPDTVASLKRIEKFGLQDDHNVNRIIAVGGEIRDRPFNKKHGGSGNRRNGGRNNHGRNRRPSSGARVEKSTPKESSEVLQKRRERFAAN